MKRLLLLFLFLPVIVLGIGSGNTIHYIEEITSKLTNQDITITPTGTGTIELVGGLSGTAFLDEDDLTSDSATKAASQQSIEAYVDSVAGLTAVTKTTTATLLTIDENIVLVDAAAGNFTVTLPAASGNSGLTYRISKTTAANAVTIDANSSELIGGELTVVLQSENDFIIISCDGSKWSYISDGVVYSAKYTSDIGQSIPATTETVISLEDIDHDTHTMCNTSGVCTIPIDGKWRISGGITFATTTAWGAGGSFFYRIRKGGTNTVIFVKTVETGGISMRVTMSGTEKLDLVKGDTIDTSIFQPLGSAKSLETSGIYNHMEIERVK